MKLDEVVTLFFSSMGGAIVGSFLSQYWTTYDRLRRERSIVNALHTEAQQVAGDVNGKIEWMRRPVDVAGLHEGDEGRFVEIDGRHLYLGENETFTVSRPYWTLKYAEAIEILDPAKFSQFYIFFRQIDAFERKFSQLKDTFESPIGDRQGMARAIFADLLTINADIMARTARLPSGRKTLS